LALEPDFGQIEVPRVAADFVGIQFHKQAGTKRLNRRIEHE
jgi:hypothetical protein